jgi:tetratricopeptide (TPR) repeat protein
MNSARSAEDQDTQAQTYYESGDYDRAIVAATRAIELKPDMARYYRNRGRIFVALGLLSAARQDFQRGASLGDDGARRELWTL